VDAWLSGARDAIAHAADVPRDQLELTDEDIRTILDLARIGAHDSGERTNAPLLCYLAGIAIARGGVLHELADAVRRAPL